MVSSKSTGVEAKSALTWTTYKSLGWLPNLQEDVPTKSAAPTDIFWIKSRKGERFRCDTRFKVVENWSVDPGKPTGELFFEWLRYAPRNKLLFAVHLAILGSGAGRSDTMNL